MGTKMELHSDIHNKAMTIEDKFHIVYRYMEELQLKEIDTTGSAQNTGILNSYYHSLHTLFESYRTIHSLSIN